VYPKLYNHVLLLLAFSFLLTAESNGQGYLHRDGQKIVDGQGKEVILRGIGLGGWMLQEGYMLKTTGPQHQLEARIKDLIGEAKTEEFYSAWLANHTRKIDIDSMAAWGYNSVRLPMHYKLFTPPVEEEPVAGQISWRQQGFEMTDKLLEWCKANNMYLILDLHAAPGGQGKNADINDYDPAKPSLWESPANQQKIVALWRKLAERYANEPMIGAYDIINEPNWGFQNIATDPNGCAENQNTLLWELQKKITAAIREVDTNHLIIIEGNCWGNNYAGLPPLWDDNMAISYHKYWNYNDQASIQNMLNMRQQRNVPVWLGESGENSNTWFTNAIKLLENNGIGWAWWPLKKLGSNNALQVVMPQGYQKVVDYWNNPQSAPRPSANEAYQALMQLTENLKLENNIYHKDVVDAMIRQPKTAEALPYRKNTIAATAATKIFAVDYDLGRHGVAYHDKDTADHHIATGSDWVIWNKGGSYRNDGVDIEPNQDAVTNGYSVGWTETGEWLQYTLNVEEKGLYTVKFRTAGATANGKLSIRVNGQKATASIALPNTGGNQNWQTTAVKDVLLQKGSNTFRVNIDKGGFNFNYMEFTRQAAPATDQPSMLEGRAKHQEDVIELVYNQPFTPFSGSQVFSVTVNGEARAISDATLKDGYEQVISLELQAPVQYGDEIIVSYTGSVVSTATGVALSTFSGLPVAVVSDTKIAEVPGTIQAEDFSVNHGFQLETTSDTGGGLNIGYTDGGDYLEYQVYISREGVYKLDYRLAAESATGKINLQLFQENSWQLLNTQTFTPTGGWQSWKTISAQVSLPKGLHTFRLNAESAGFNLNWLALSFLYPAGLHDKQPENSAVRVYPNPGSNTFTLSLEDVSQKLDQLLIVDLSGRKLLSMQPEQRASVYQVNHNLSQGMYILIFELEGKRLSRKLLVE
jgi:endoglucanase